MRNLPLALQRYLFAVYACAGAVLLCCLLIQPRLPIDYPSVILFVLLAIFTELNPVSYINSVSQTTITAVLFSSIFIFPPLIAVAIGVIAIIIYDSTSRKAWYKILFNAAYRVNVYGTMALFSYYGQINVSSIQNITGLAQIILVFFLYVVLSTLLLGTVIALASGQNIVNGWRESIISSNYYDLALLPYGLILAWLWHSNPWVFFIGLSPLIAIQRSFVVHARLITEQAATARLAAQQHQVQEATTILLSSKDIHTQLDTLLKHLMEVFPVNGTSVVVWGDFDEPDQVVNRGDCSIEEPIETWAEHLRQVSEGRQLVRIDHPAARRLETKQSMMLVPLVTPDDTVGCLVLVTADAFALDQQGERLIETFATQAALAIYQARLIARLKSSQVQVVQSERLAAIGTLAAGVAHEFNNLLSGIGGISQLAILEDDPAEQRSALEIVAKAAQQGGSITRGLLTFARHLEPNRELADMRNAVEPVLSMLQAEFRRENITIDSKLKPVTPLLCDIGMLSQVTLNLLTNAIDALHPHGGTITVELEEQDGYVHLAVSDTGSGIPEHIRSRIFEPFVSSKKPAEGKLHGGTGLGLAITYGIVTDHGGTIDVHSEVGVGTTMTIRLPIKLPQPEPVAQPILPEPLHVIVIDDEALTAKALHSLITREGHISRWFTEPMTALEAMGHEPVDVVFADLVMPNMDGLALLQRVYELVPWATRVIITGQIDAPQLERVRASGVDAIVEKPFSVDTIRTLINNIRAAQVVA